MAGMLGFTNQASNTMNPEEQSTNLLGAYSQLIEDYGTSNQAGNSLSDKFALPSGVAGYTTNASQYAQQEVQDLLATDDGQTIYNLLTGYSSVV